MNTGVEILLKRMQDCPEDFDYKLNEGRPSRWMRLVDHAIGDELLTLEEHEALKAGLVEMKRERFTEMVMKELAGAEDETSDEGKSYINHPSATSLGGLTLTTNPNGSLAWSNSAASSVADAQKYQTEQLRLHLDAHRFEIEKEAHKQEQIKMLEEILAKKRARNK